MEKIYGATGRQDGLYRIGKKKWELIYGFGKDSEDAATGWNYRQRFTAKPSEEEIKAVLVEAINEHTKETILNGFVWNGLRVWLSDEKQRNFLMMERLTSEAYPLTIKINEDADGKPVYYTFVNEEEFAMFSKLSSQHVTETLKAGWDEKDSLDPKTFGF